MTQRWIEIVDWHKFQHYADRDPPWIKNYTRLLSDPNYGYLSHAQRSTLHGLWLLYARSGCQIPDSTAWITRQLGVRVTRVTLESLNHAGFIRFSASNPLALARSQETEAEKDQRQARQAVASYVERLPDFQKMLESAKPEGRNRGEYE